MGNFCEYLEKYDRGEIKNFEELYQKIKYKNFGYDELKELGKRYISYREPSVILNFGFQETKMNSISKAISSFLRYNKIFDENDKDKLILFDSKLKINFIIDLKLNKNDLEKEVLDLFEKTYSLYFSIIKSSTSKLENEDFEKLSNNEKIIEKDENGNKTKKSKFIEVQDGSSVFKYFRNRNLEEESPKIERDDDEIIEKYKIDIEKLKIKREKPYFKDMNKSDISGEKVDNLIENEKHRNNIENRDINEENYKLYNLLKFKAKEKLLGLNYNDEKEEIEEIFKNVYGDLNYEQNLQLLLDKDKKIVEIIDTTLKDGIKEMIIGIIDSVFNKTNKEKKRIEKIDRIIKSKYNIDNELKNISDITFYYEKLFKIIKKNKEVNYFVNLHNHPDNIPVPSIKDLNVNNIVYKNIINKIFRETKRKIILYEDLIITKDNIVDINLINDLMPEIELLKINSKLFPPNLNIRLEDNKFIQECILSSSEENRKRLVKKYEDNFEKALREKLEKIKRFETCKIK